MAAVWEDIARGYSAFSGPLVPSSEDIGIYEDLARRSLSDVRSGVFNAVVLGVTPDIVRMNWPVASRILAIEKSPAVIRALWPGDISGFCEVRCASWFDMPVELHSAEMVVGDGALSACRYPEEVRVLGSEVSRVLRPGGMFVVRAYIQPPVAESVESVFDALWRAGGLSVDVFKMRLWLAMQRSASEGVAVRHAAKIMQRFGIDRQYMREHLGWCDAAVEPFEKWGASDAVYSFPSLAELRALFSDRFEEVSVTYPTYRLGECCPVLALRSRGYVEGAISPRCRFGL